MVTMCEKEIDKYVDEMKKYTKKISKNKKESFELLKKAGIINAKGKLTSQYKVK